MEKIVIDVILGIKVGFFAKFSKSLMFSLYDFMISNKIYYNLSKIYEVK